MTLFWPDCSNNNWSSTADALNFCAQLVSEGFSGITHKVSEGSYYEDPFWPVVQAWCQENDVICVGYHYLSTESPAAQAQTWLDHGGGNLAMFDWEQNGGNLANFWAVANAFNAVGVTVQIGYCPQWYWNQVGGGDLSQIPFLISSAYPWSSGGYASNIYAADGGDSGEGWNSYGNATPRGWQFTDQALIAGKTVDCNAFRGTLAEFQTALGLTPATPPVTPPVIPPAPTAGPTYATGTKPGDEADQVSDVFDQEVIRWPFLNNNTAAEALGVIGAALKIPGYYDPTAQGVPS